MQLSQHPWGAVLPPLAEDDQMKLEASILKIGIQQPITVLDDMVLTGWNRYQAALKLGVECPMEEYDRDRHGEDPRAYVAAMDLHRRHIPSAIMRVNLIERLYQTAGPGRPTEKPRQDDEVSPPPPEPEQLRDHQKDAIDKLRDGPPSVHLSHDAGAGKTPPLTRQQVAEMADTSTATVDRARAERKREASAGDEVRGEQNARAQRADRKPSLRQRHDDTLDQLSSLKRELTLAKRRIEDLERLEKLRADQDRPDTAERVRELTETQRELADERAGSQNWMARYQEEQKRSAYYLRLLREAGIDPNAPGS